MADVDSKRGDIVLVLCMLAGVQCVLAVGDFDEALAGELGVLHGHDLHECHFLEGCAAVSI